MDLNDTPDQAEYRATVRAWIEANKSKAPTHLGDDDESVAAHRAWQRELAGGKLVGITWPQEFGGGGRGPLEMVIANQEISRAEIPGIFDVIGVGMLGPTIIAHGSEAQKERYLDPMLHAEEVWCQLFSEPAAGSDLAGIQARAKQLDDGSWKVSGQKVWTTNAQHAQYGLLLARTDSDVPKHKGLTMFIVPMDAEGITIRPLRQIDGHPDFNEVFLDDVVLDAGSEVGAVGGGWGVALTTLMFERLAIGGSIDALGFRSDAIAEAIITDEAASQDPEVRHRLGAIATDLTAIKFFGFRLLTQLQKGQIPGPEAGLAKITAVNAGIAAGDLLVDVDGIGALDEPSAKKLVSFMPGLKSAGGTEQILKNTIGERVLGLPPEPRLDKGIPFSELKSLEKEGATA
mgnify:CR=1 FL=1